MKITMPYIGGQLSVNSYKVVGKGGLKTNKTREDVEDWKWELINKVRGVGAYLTLPIEVHVFGKFRDNRHPDMDNLFKVVCDGLKLGLGIDDKHFIPVSDGFSIGWLHPTLEIEIKEVNKNAL